MTVSVFTVILLFFAHWVADFVCQDEQWALNKSKSFKALLKHTTTYTLVLGLFFFWLFWEYTFLFMLINFVFHTLTDYFTSKIVSKRFENKYLGGRIPNLGAFSIIGLGQFLHYVVLLISFTWILLTFF